MFGMNVFMGSINHPQGGQLQENAVKISGNKETARGLKGPKKRRMGWEQRDKIPSKDDSHSNRTNLKTGQIRNRGEVQCDCRREKHRTNQK